VGKNFEIIFKEFHNSETFVMSRALLEDYKRQATQAERERIIALIAENIVTACPCKHCDSKRDIIPLINQENN
jgi:transposase